MSQEQIKKIAIKVVVTFVEAAAAYWVATGNLVNKAALAGAVGAGISAAYNVLRHYFIDK